ncbi:MAG TPA: hypothetical protein VHO72_17210 [Bacteroidales bacterium]|nr:hypothetical protein [Bacteroidales bacterium]
MSQENLYDKLQEFLGKLQGNYNVLEEQINIDVQMEYFESSKEIKNSVDAVDTLNTSDNLFSESVSIEDKKLLLVQLASIGKVEAFRTLEKYNNNPDPELKDWSTLAMQESRMHLESSFLDENQVFISTGLGGKGKKLRYFIVFLAKDEVILDDFQRRIVEKEVGYIFQKNDSEIEETTSAGSFIIMKALIPIPVAIQEILEEAIAECNQYGNFLQTNFIITNVKELTFEEIQNIITAQRSDEENNMLL